MPIHRASIRSCLSELPADHWLKEPHLHPHAPCSMHSQLAVRCSSCTLAPKQIASDCSCNRARAEPAPARPTPRPIQRTGGDLWNGLLLPCLPASLCMQERPRSGGAAAPPTHHRGPTGGQWRDRRVPAAPPRGRAGTQGTGSGGRRPTRRHGGLGDSPRPYGATGHILGLRRGAALPPARSTRPAPGAYKTRQDNRVSAPGDADTLVAPVAYGTGRKEVSQWIRPGRGFCCLLPVRQPAPRVVHRAVPRGNEASAQTVPASRSANCPLAAPPRRFNFATAEPPGH
jgi:hypothetical protein